MNIAVRVDASHEMGTGHLMRCLTLATGLRQRGDHVRFVGRDVPAHLRELVQAQQCEFVALAAATADEPSDELAHAGWLGGSQAGDAARTERALAGRTWDWVVVDHYALDHRWESRLRGMARRILAIDDLADRRHDCDALLDQNFYTDAGARYHAKVPAGCQLLLGPHFALLRDEFRKAHQHQAARRGAAGRVLVNFGGVDAGNATGQAIAALAATGAHLAVDVVIGPEHPCRHDLEAQCVRHGFALHVQTNAMAALMSAADVAIGAGGTAIWERCCLGLPALTFVLAENQRRQVNAAAAAGLLVAPAPAAAGELPIATHFAALIENPNLLTMIARTSQAVVDGQGVVRVIRRLLAGGITVRDATPADSSAILAWRNHPSVRLLSRNAAAIEQPDHDAWFAAALQNPDRVLLIGELDRAMVGVVRFDVTGDHAEVSIHLAPEHQGGGLGPGLLLAAEQRLTSVRRSIRVIIAEVMGGNDRSQRLFTGCGYETRSLRLAKAVPR